MPHMEDNQHGLGLGADLMNQSLNIPGQEMFNHQVEQSYSNISPGHNRNESMASEMGQADHFPPPTINIEPAAPVSRQQSFGPLGEHPQGGLSPPPSSSKHAMDSALTPSTNI